MEPINSKVIKKELKQKFPKTKFSITKGSGMANKLTYINYWANQPSKEKVLEITKKYGKNVILIQHNEET